MTFTVIFTLYVEDIMSGKTIEKTVSTEDIVSLRFVKERYTPYTQLTGKVAINTEVYDIKSIMLKAGDKVTHFGPPDRFEWEIKENRYIVSFTSRGYSCALGQNQLTPGLHYSISFEELMTSEIALPHVEYQKLNNKLNYVYIKENDTMWDTAKAFTRKLIEGHPSLLGANTVIMSREGYYETLYLDKDDIISASVGGDLTHVMSHFHMKNVEGSYNTYNLTNNDAVARDIIRHKHIPFDRQWLSDPDEAMQYRFDFSERGKRFAKVTYWGYNNEELRQRVAFNASKIQVRPSEISRIELSITPKGAITTLWCYHDRYTYLTLA